MNKNKYYIFKQGSRLAIMAASKKWTMPIQNWKAAMNGTVANNHEW